jgi:hypothetical protein
MTVHDTGVRNKSAVDVKDLGMPFKPFSSQSI